MMDSLNAAKSGLSTSQYVIDNISNNIANENNDEYIKRVANTSEMSYDDNSYANGVNLTSVSRSTNEYLFEKITNQTSSTSYYNEASDIYALIETAFEETDDSGLSIDLDNYFQAIENLRTDPYSIVYEADVEAKAEALVERLQSLYTDILSEEESIVEQTYNEVDTVNTLLGEIVEINKSLINNGENLTLLDKRDALELELSQYVDIEVDTSNADYYKLSIANETAIFHNTLYYEVKVVEDPSTQKNTYDTTDLDDASITTGDEIIINFNNTSSLTLSADITTGGTDYDVKQQIIDAINNDETMKEFVTASFNDKNELVVESLTAGEEAEFDLEIILENSIISVNEYKSQDAGNDVHLQILENELELNSGSLNALTENMTTLDDDNMLSAFKDSLDEIAYALSDYSSSYVLEDGEYIINGDDATTLYSLTQTTGSASISNINLFSGTSVLTLDFNVDVVENLSQDDLDYLAQLQWNDELTFGNSSTPQSLSEAIQVLKVEISATKENTDFKLESAEAVELSLTNTYDELTKVDGDEELINLMKYQAAYQANAKVITAVDEMLQTLLAM